MTPQARRILIPTVVIAIALGIVAIMAVSGGKKPTPAKTPEKSVAADTSSPETPVDDADDVAIADETASDEAPGIGAPVEVTPPSGLTFDKLIARAPANGLSGPDAKLPMIGSLDPDIADMQLVLSTTGAGLKKITFSNIWETALPKQLADRFHKTGKGQLPPDEERYVLQTEQLLQNARFAHGVQVPVLAANQIRINGSVVNLLAFSINDAGEKIFIWSLIDHDEKSATFESEVVDTAGTLIARLTRRWELGTHFGLTLEQRIENLTDQPLTVEWSQFGPGDLRMDRAGYMDRRRFRFGFINPSAPSIVLSSDSDLLFERGTVLKMDETLLWPNEESIDRGYDLSWFAATNRYFGVGVFAPVRDTGTPDKTVGEAIDRILQERSYSGTPNDNSDDIVFTHLVSPEREVPPGASADFTLGVYAGPLAPSVLEKQQPYVSLNMGALILYQMSSWCAICTFQWLAHGLLWFLSIAHAVTFDWGIAIILLVLVVRTILHPITKKSQVSMQRFGKVMQDLKPEIDKLQKKYPNDPKKVQTEQLRLMRERGVNPAQMLGCLPMFLQTPIWIALYAMLYFAWPLRHEPALWGIFQRLTDWNWSFLADLSAGDHCFWEFAEPTKVLFFTLTGINLLPILLMGVYFVQQKYMAPPPSPNTTPEQLQQQKIMRWMLMLFPIVLYTAPSGLLLYMLTSSVIGIMESRYIRRHISEMDLNPPKPKKSSKAKDAQGRAFAAAMERMEAKRRQKQKGPEKRYKKRK